jgi:hypothetical protein
MGVSSLKGIQVSYPVSNFMHFKEHNNFALKLVCFPYIWFSIFDHVFLLSVGSAFPDPVHAAEVSARLHVSAPGSTSSCSFVHVPADRVSRLSLDD